MKEIKKTIAAALVALTVLMFGTGCLYAMAKQLDKPALSRLRREALARSVEQFKNHSRIPSSNPKSKIR